jgi:hypothetical protein
MHPFVGTRLRLALYLATWLALGTLLALVPWLTWGLKIAGALTLMVPLGLMFGAIGLSALWVCRSLPLDRTPAIRLVTGAVGAALQASAVWAAIATLWGVLLTRQNVITASRQDILLGVGALFVLGIPAYLGSMVVHYLWLTFEASRQAEKKMLQTEVTAREAEIRALRAQLNPHFLFNSLNSINALVGSDPEGARRMCESLGIFLRRTLALGARETIPLGEELALVDQYFAIERVRFGPRLNVERYVETGAETCLVPPLLLQPLVENAIKHGIADRVDGGTIRLAAIVVEERLRISVENDVDDDAVGRPGEGVGLENVRRRLDALSARETRLDTARETGRFRVTLALPARRAVAGEVHA